METVPVWVQAVVAAISLGGAAVSWWRSELSKTARLRAEAARENAERERELAEQNAAAAQRAADALAELASTLRRRRLEVTVTGEPGSKRITIRNESGEPVTIRGVVNRDEFLRLDAAGGERWPITIHDGSLLQLIALEAMGYSMPREIVLEIEGDEAPAHFGLASR